MFYGFVITEAGNQMLAKMVAGDTLELSGVFMDLGTVEDKETARQLTAPLEPGPAGTSTVPTVKGNQVGMIVQFRSDLDGGLKADKWIGGFGVYAKDPDTGDPVMIYYLDTLKASGEAITPKAWRAEAQRLTAEKEADYLKMRDMREDIKAVENLKKTAEHLAREGQTQRREEQER